MAHAVTLSLAERYGDPDGGNKKVTCRPQHPRDALEVTIKLLDALDGLHKRGSGSVYCDVQPEKVMVTTTDLAEEWRAKNPYENTFPPTDMGQRLEVSLARPEDTCQPILSPGRPRCWEYSAPEQWRGEHVGEKTDVFGTAGVLFYLLSGHSPFFLEAPKGGKYGDLEPNYRALAEKVGVIPGEFDDRVPGDVPAWLRIDHPKGGHYLWHDSLGGSGVLGPGITGGLRHLFWMTLGQKKDTRIDLQTMRRWLEVIRDGYTKP
jgi:hypothetical protein